MSSKPQIKHKKIEVFSCKAYSSNLQIQLQFFFLYCKFYGLCVTLFFPPCLRIVQHLRVKQATFLSPICLQDLFNIFKLTVAFGWLITPDPFDDT